VQNPNATVQPSSAWSQIRTIYRYELRGALRERTIVINSILIPIFLYPLIMWAGFTGVMFIQGHSDSTKSRIAVLNVPREHPGLRARFERDRRINIVRDASATPDQIQRGNLDAIVEFVSPEAERAALPGNFTAKITFNGSKDRSNSARQRVEGAIERYRRDWVAREGRKLGISDAEWAGFKMTSRNLASEKQMGGFVLGMLIPVLFVVMVAAGCFYPAIDCTAGERERNTWETLMSSAAKRVHIVVAKYLYVTTLGGLAGALNLVAFALTLKPMFAPLLAQAGVTFNFAVPPAAIPLLILAAVLLAGFVAAGMMIFASFARTFKEGQAMIMPFYLLVMLPPIVLQSPGIQFTTTLALIPVVNVAMMVRSVVTGIYPWVQIGITIAVSLAMIALCVRLAAFILRFEDVMAGAYNGSIKQFFRERLFGKAKSSGGIQT